MQLSVVVPTHDRPAVLRDCLQTLQEQDVDPERLEVVVVDDGSEADIASLVAEVAASGPISMRYERQELAGLNKARNHGTAAARGDVVAFLDDDTRVVRGWAAAMLEAFADPECAGAGGRVELELALPEPEWMAPSRCYLAEYERGPQPASIDDDRVPVGANCAVRRDWLERLGGFSSGLDRFGTSLLSNGDTELFRRLRAAGGRLRYVPNAHVIHRIPAERMTVDFFLKRYEAQGLSDELLLRHEGHHSSLGHLLALSRHWTLSAQSFAWHRLWRRSTVHDMLLITYWRSRLRAAWKTRSAAAVAPALPG